jgi:glycine/D-amino acid oxidase-like deaminating enzyme
MADFDTTPYWQTTVALPRFRSLDRDLRVDVAIVGGGITGITAAYLLKKAGKRVALFERHRCLRADTGHTTAHLTCVTDTRLSELVKSFGADHARATWDAGLAAIAQIDGLVRTEAIECGFAWVPGYLHAPPHQPAQDSEREAATLRDEANQIEELGFDARYLDRVPFMNVPGIEIAGQARFNPIQYLAALLARVHGGDGHVFEETNVDEVNADANESTASLIVGSHTVTCDYVIIATHNPPPVCFPRRCCRRSSRCTRPTSSADACRPDRFPTRCSGILPIHTTTCVSIEVRTAARAATKMW